jgi:hypothetical protein
MSLDVFRCLWMSLELNQIIGKEIKEIEIHIKNEKIVNTLRQQNQSYLGSWD